MARGDYEHLSRDQLLTVLAERDARIERLEARIAQLEAHVAKLEQLLDDATRGGIRSRPPTRSVRRPVNSGPTPRPPWP